MRNNVSIFFCSAYTLQMCHGTNSGRMERTSDHKTGEHTGDSSATQAHWLTLDVNIVSVFPQPLIFIFPPTHSAIHLTSAQSNWRRRWGILTPIALQSWKERQLSPFQFLAASQGTGTMQRNHSGMFISNFKSIKLHF